MCYNVFVENIEFFGIGVIFVRGKARIISKNGVSVWMRKIGDRYWVVNGVLVYIEPDVNERSDSVMVEIVQKMNTSFIFVPSVDFNGLIVVRKSPDTGDIVCKFFGRLTVEDSVLEKLPAYVEDYKLYSGYYEQECHKHSM